MDKKRKKAVTFGVFDLTHSGHFNLITNAYLKGLDVYVVVWSDESLKKYKSDFKLSEETRKVNVENFIYVKEVKILSRDSFEEKKNYIDEIGAETIFFGEDNRENPWIKEFVEKTNVEVVWLPRTQNISSTILKKKLDI